MVSTAGQRNPYPTVDVIIEVEGKIVLVKRKNPPYGWAIPGGFIDAGERAEDAAVREAKEETGLDVKLVDLLGVYSDPDRDPRFHTLSVVYVGRASGNPVAGDDAGEVGLFDEKSLPEDIAFDHRKILEDYFAYKKEGKRPFPPSR
ncbi:MAG: NUDIX hydrolase [Deltaproteobacteria bacterium]|nr:MAG: NUDIX hydrolase [Deltaproteobacteria bacterium]